MITRVFHGKSAYGLVKYLYGDGRRNEHIDAHMVASWDGNPAGLEPVHIEAIGKHHVAPLAATLEQPVRSCDRPPKQHVYHLVVRAAPEDRRLSDEEWAEVATAAMDAAGLAPTGDPAGCRWVAVRHAEDHLHVVATTVREDGRPARTWGDYAKLGKLAERFEHQFELRSTVGLRDKTANQRPGVKEQVTAEHAGRRTSPRITLRSKVQAAVASSGSFDEFTARLAGDGVSVWPRMSDRNPDQITGYSVSLNDWTNAAGDPVRFGGGKLAPDLSWPKLRARWVSSGDARETGATASADRSSTWPRPDAPTGTTSTRARRSQPGPLTAEEAERAWREAEQIVQQAADRIRTEASTDPHSAADAAWAASDTLTAAAAGVEGDAGGPLTDAAAAFDRAGREVNLGTPMRTDTGTALRATGRMVALLAAGNQHPAARIAALTIALASLTAAIADLRATQHRAHQAAAARSAAEHLLGAAPATGRSRSPAGQHVDWSRPRNAAAEAALSAPPGTFRLRPLRTDQPAGPRPHGPQRPGPRRDDGPRQGR